MFVLVTIPEILKRNNFDLLRLLFAATVCLVHVYDLSRLPQLDWLMRYLSSAVAVKSFFIVSGFLIFMSYERSSSASSYFEKRIRRIYPAYAVVILMSSFFLFFISTADFTQYFSVGWLKYVVANLMFLNFLQPDLPMVFESHRYSAINGALWTLKIEMMFYFCVPFIAYLFRKYSPAIVMCIIYLLSITYAEVLSFKLSQTANPLYGMFAKQLPGQMCYFIAGASCFYFFDFFKKWSKFLFVIAAVILLLDNRYPLYLLEPMALALVVVSAAFLLYFGNVGKYGDFSYGLYITHFPIIQIFVHFGWLRTNPHLFLLTVVLCSLLSGFLMWHLIEKRFLLTSSHYRSIAVK